MSHNHSGIWQDIMRFEHRIIYDLVLPEAIGLLTGHAAYRIVGGTLSRTPRLLVLLNNVVRNLLLAIRTQNTFHNDL